MKLKEIKYDKKYNKTYIYFVIDNYEDFNLIISQTGCSFTYGWKYTKNNTDYGNYHQTEQITLIKLHEIEEKIKQEIEDFKKLGIYANK